MLFPFLQLSQSDVARITDWGSVLAKNPYKEKKCMAIFLWQWQLCNQIPHVSNIERVRQTQETYLIVKVKVNTCMSGKVYQFIKELQEASCLTLSTHRGEATFNGQKINSELSHILPSQKWRKGLKIAKRFPEYISSGFKLLLSLYFLFWIDYCQN